MRLSATDKGGVIFMGLDDKVFGATSDNVTCAPDQR